MHNFTKLDIWVDGVELADMVYSLTESFPHHEVYGLASQMQRAAVSVPSNIAEGSGKGSNRDFARFLAISLGSLFELQTQVEIAHRRAYISTENYYSVLTSVLKGQSAADYSNRHRSSLLSGLYHNRDR